MKRFDLVSIPREACADLSAIHRPTALPVHAATEPRHAAVAARLVEAREAAGLATYHNGDRSSPMVVSYYRHSGIAPPIVEQAA